MALELRDLLPDPAVACLLDWCRLHVRLHVRIRGLRIRCITPILCLIDFRYITLFLINIEELFVFFFRSRKHLNSITGQIIMIVAVLTGCIIKFDFVTVCRIICIILINQILICSEILTALLDVLTPDLNRDLYVLVIQGIVCRVCN